MPCVKPYVNDNTEICITCPLEKFTKLPFALSESRALEQFELVHMDIWGPYKTPTRGKFRYFMTIVDDCTRHTWIYLIQYKSEALSTLQSFQNYVYTQFQKKIKILRTDNALEFDDTPCQKFFAESGIVHQTSCVKRPQQNARVERKHRHVLEMARGLRFQSGLALQY